MDLVVKGCERRSCGFCRGIGSGNFLRARSFFSCRSLGCCGSQRFACGMFGTPGIVEHLAAGCASGNQILLPFKRGRSVFELSAGCCFIGSSCVNIFLTSAFMRQRCLCLEALEFSSGLPPADSERFIIEPS